MSNLEQKRKGLKETISIGSPVEEHLASFHELIDILSREPLHLTAIEPPNAKTLRKAVQNHIADHLPLVIAFTKNKVVGWCAIGQKLKPGFTHTGVMGIGLLPDYRRVGIGTSLLNAALAKAQKTQLLRIELEVFSKNAPAIAFYNKHEFTVEGCKVNARLHEGIYDDVIIMARFL